MKKLLTILPFLLISSYSYAGDDGLNATDTMPEMVHRAHIINTSNEYTISLNVAFQDAESGETITTLFTHLDPRASKLRSEVTVAKQVSQYKLVITDLKAYTRRGNELLYDSNSMEQSIADACYTSFSNDVLQQKQLPVLQISFESIETEHGDILNLVKCHFSVPEHYSEFKVEQQTYN